MTHSRRRHSVALNRPDDTSHNTIVLAGLDLVVPVEIDLDDDAETEDEVRLESDDGWYEAHVRSSEDSVERDGDRPVLLYPFEEVPPGIYSVATKVGDTWWTVIRGLRVTRAAVYYGDTKLHGDRDDWSKLGTPEESEDTGSDGDGGDDGGGDDRDDGGDAGDDDDPGDLCGG
jgi:hypothetical protein